MANQSFQPLIPIFNGQNYYIWSIKMKTMFKSQDLWDLVQNGYPNLDTEPQETRKNDATALFLIQQAMDDDIFPRIAKAVTSKEAWDILRNDFGTTKEEDSVQGLLSKLSGLVDHMKSLGDTISRETVVSNVLTSLGFNFDEKKGLLQVKDKSWRNDRENLAGRGRNRNVRRTEWGRVGGEKPQCKGADEAHQSRVRLGDEKKIQAMAGAPERSQRDTYQFDAKMTELALVDAEDFFTSYEDVFDSFDAMGLHVNLLRGIYANGFEKPSASQQRGVVPFCKGLDVILQGQPGTEKTLTFCFAILQQLDYSLVQCQALVLAPTKQSALQIEKVLRALGDYLGVKVHACVGGTSVREDQRILQSGVNVVVGTPGRVFDMLKRPSLRVDSIRMFVLDKADELLSCSFKDQVYNIFQRLPSKIQIGVSCETIPQEALQFIRKFMNKPVRILVRDELMETVPN